MPSSVYSTRFVKSALTNANVTYYTVPAGFVAVVRTMTAAWTTTGTTGGVVQVLLNGANSWVWVVKTPAPDSDSALWDGRLVLPAGELIRAAATASGTIHLTVSGYLLSV